MAVPDNVDAVVVVLAVLGVGLGELGLDQLLEADGSGETLRMAVAAGPVVLGVVDVLEFYTVLA